MSHRIRSLEIASVVVAKAVGRFSRRIDGKHLLYLPKNLVEDSAFPFRVRSSVPARVVMDSVGRTLLIEHLAGNESPFRKKH